MSTEASGEEGVIGLVGFEWDGNMFGMDRVLPCDLEGGQSFGEPMGVWLDPSLSIYVGVLPLD